MGVDAKMIGCMCFGVGAGELNQVHTLLLTEPA